jgi:hypothetical protein
VDGYDAFLALGDEQYEYGRYRDFVQNYDAYFGRLLPITGPVPGNHEYGTTDAAELFPVLRGGREEPARLVLVRPRELARDRAQLGRVPSLHR